MEPRHSLIPEAELGAMNSLVAVVMSEERTASLAVTLVEVELLEPTVPGVVTVLDFAVEAKNLGVDGYALGADGYALGAAGPMIVGA